MPRRAERAPQHAVEREVEIGIVEHDHRVLAAHLEREPLVHAAAGLADNASRFSRSREGDHGNLRVRYDRGAYCFTDAVHELNDFGRQPRLEESLDEHRTGMWDILRGLEDARITTEQRWKHLPRRNRHRKVERRDDAANPNRTSVAHRPLVAHLARHGVAEQTAPLGCGVVRRVDPLLDVAARLGEWLPHLSRHEIGDLVLASRQDVADTPQNVTARGRGRRAPHVEAALRGLHRARDVRVAGERESPDDI